MASSFARTSTSSTESVRTVWPNPRRDPGHGCDLRERKKPGGGAPFVPKLTACKQGNGRCSARQKKTKLRQSTQARAMLRDPRREARAALRDVRFFRAQRAFQARRRDRDRDRHRFLLLARDLRVAEERFFVALQKSRVVAA